MAKKTKNIDAKNKADAVKKLVLTKDSALERISAFEEKIEQIRKEISAIDAQLNSLLGLGVNSSPTVNKSYNPKLEIPKSGMVMDMAEVMSKDVPMHRREIIDAMKKKGYDTNENSIRSYLTNLKCFESIKKNDPRYGKKGWICHADMLPKRG